MCNNFFNRYVLRKRYRNNARCRSIEPVIILTRESKDRLRVRGPYYEHVVFAPWRTKSIVLMLEHLMGECAKSLLSPCEANISHCITQIKPEEIVADFDEMKKFVKGG